MKPPLYLINGPLGAGKTTLLKHLLASERFQHARVIENEFASTSVDTDQLRDHRAEVRTIAGVCICCSTGKELETALEELAEGSAEPVIVEATGVASSRMLIEKLAAARLLDYYTIGHVVFVLDAAEAATRPELIDTYRDELRLADTIAVSKTDLLEPEEVFDLMQQLEAASDGRIETMYYGELNVAVLEQPSALSKESLEEDSTERSHDDEPSYSIIAGAAEVGLTPVALHAAWPRLVALYGVERMKGAFIHDDTIWHVDATPSQCRITEGSPTEALSLVLIGAEAARISDATFTKVVHS